MSIQLETRLLAALKSEHGPRGRHPGVLGGVGCCDWGAKCEVGHLIDEAENSLKTNDDVVLKENLIKVVRDHKATCVGEECQISVSMLLLLALKAGIVFTDEERREFA